MLHYHAVPVTVRAVLQALAPPLLATGFSLAGGTSLALRCGHRRSMDLDFFTTENFDAEELLRQLELPRESVVDRAAGTLRLLWQGVQIDFLRHAYPLLEEPVTLDGIRMLSLADVAAMKLNAITNRGSKKDFFDLAMLLERRTLPELLEACCRKYSASNKFMVIRSLAWFDDAEAEPDPESLTNLSWPAVKATISAALASLT
ncbi:MAG: nucleotidyl transferase AbiEii/AbiGii toxin family protein [Verrucomicrobia bacterium]|nr:nucleotidyl transferase AbiEii/AbiGii toxin family protein [Verrucomicrobiota bacterium]